MRHNFVPSVVLLAGLALSLWVASLSRGAPAMYFPPPEAAGGWRSIVPPNAVPTDAQKREILERTALDWDALNRAWDYDLNTVGIEKAWPGNPRKSLLVIRRGWIAFERYHSPDGSYNKDTRVAFASGTKTLVGVSLARLFSQGRCKDTDFLHHYMPASWVETDPARRKIQLRHVLSMSSGLEPFDGPYHPDTYADIIRNLAVIAEPGAQWFYNTGALDLLNFVIAGCSGRKMDEFLNEEIMRPIGAGDVFVASRHRFEGHGFCSFYQLTPRDYARIGYLFLQQGRWGDRHIIERDVVALATTLPDWLPAASVGVSAGSMKGANENYGYTFWLNRTGERIPGLPRDAYLASGGNHKMIVIPSLDLIVVRVGNYVHDTAEVNRIYGIIRQAVTDERSEDPRPESRPPSSSPEQPRAPAIMATASLQDAMRRPAGRHLEIEAESGLCLAPMRVDADASNPAVRYAWVPPENTANYDVPGGPGALGLAFHVSETGAYNIWVRTIAPGPRSDSYFLCLDGVVIDRPWNTEVVPQSAAWRWHKIRDRRPIDAGNHVMEFRHRESGVKLDKVIVTSDLNFVP